MVLRTASPRPDETTAHRPSGPAAERGRTPTERDYYTLSARVYAAFAPFYDLVTVPFLSRLRREVARVAGVDHATSVLDVATGTGAQALAFAARCGHAVGIDLSESMLRVARRKSRSSRLSLVRADAVELPFADASFDLTCVSFALHEMPESVRLGTLREMARVTRPAGTIVVVDYSLPPGRLARTLVFWTVRLYEHDTYPEFVRSDLPALLREAGIGVRSDHRALVGAARIVTGFRLDGSI